MTKNDWRYLFWFGGLLIIVVVAVLSKAWILASLFGFVVILFVVHASLNLLSPPSSNAVLSLLRKVEGSNENNYFSKADENNDYSEWDAFCDTPIINDRLLNSIRVKCYHLRNAAISQRASIDSPIAMSESAIREIGQYIREIERRSERRV